MDRALTLDYKPLTSKIESPGQTEHRPNLCKPDLIINELLTFVPNPGYLLGSDPDELYRSQKT